MNKSNYEDAPKRAIPADDVRPADLLRTIEEAQARREELLNRDLHLAAEPLVRYLQENYHPHTTVIVTYDSAELVIGSRVVRYGVPD